ncbi:DUF4013 domain-containing protein [Candidatus Woesearchaeota archaeon]|nr:DUF4013 domain-containing protein [Candidatus Woesearchaeota archaeon]
MGVDYQLAFKRPFADAKTFIIGFVVAMIPIVNLFAEGYFLECARKPRYKNLPEWKDWGKLFVDGLLAFIITLIYFIPVGIIAFATLGSAIAAILLGGVTDVSAFAALRPALLIAVLLALITYYVSFSAVISFAQQGKFSAAFAFGRVFRKALTADYFLAWLLVIAVSVILYAGLSFIPVVGGAVAAFYVGVFTYTIMGQSMLVK